MASRSPTATERGPSGREARLAYIRGWKALTLLLDRGYSWSGSERNSCFLNLGDGTFADASAVAGLDFTDDGRAALVTDWDADGDLDLWLRNRTGPQLRLMRNDAPARGRRLALLLHGVTCNKDAVGARVELTAGGRKLVRVVSCGEGYLAQSSRWLHFGLGGAGSVDRLVVRWPGGEAEEVAAPPPEGRFLVIQGTGRAVPASGRPVALAPGPLEGPRPAGARVVLRTPLPLPPTLRAVTDAGADAAGATLVVLWAHWCAPCLEELGDLAARREDLAREGLRVVAIGLDEQDDRKQAEEVWRTRVAPAWEGGSLPGVRASGAVRTALRLVVSQVLAVEDQALSLPSSLLVDGKGALQVIYLGPAAPDRVLEDARRFATDPVAAPFRGAWPGRWYFHTPRALDVLRQRLEEAGLERDAKAYSASDGRGARGR